MYVELQPIILQELQLENYVHSTPAPQIHHESNIYWCRGLSDRSDVPPPPLITIGQASTVFSISLYWEYTRIRSQHLASSHIKGGLHTQTPDT